jgi:type II secretory pathway component GspD/PulD (secretin)
MGGLVQEGEYSTVRKVPILGDLPFVGRALFTAEAKAKERTELVFFLTPRIVQTEVADN